MRHSPLFIIFMGAVGLLIMLLVTCTANASNFYLEGAVGFQDGDRGEWNNSGKLGHFAFGYEWDNEIFVEIAHDSDLQAHDIGIDRIYLGIRKEF